jgi:hypothetical protein
MASYLYPSSVSAVDMQIAKPESRRRRSQPKKQREPRLGENDRGENFWTTEAAKGCKVVDPRPMVTINVRSACNL